MTTSRKVIFAILICILVGCTLFLLALADYTWTYSGWNIYVKLGATMPMVIWLLFILGVVARMREDQSVEEGSSSLSDDEKFKRIMANQDHFAKVIGKSLRKKE